MRPRRAATATPIDILERELSEVDRLFGKHSKRSRSTGRSGERHRDGEKMVVVDHQRGKTDITVVQQTVIASPDAGHAPSDALAAKPIIADLAAPEHNGHSFPPSSDERREPS
jgi:hypothetical protein